MRSLNLFNRLSVKLTISFLIAATSGVALVALLAYRLASQSFATFNFHVQGMQQMMGGMMGGMMGRGRMPDLARASAEFLDSLGQAFWISGLAGAALALALGLFFTRQIVSPVSRVSRAAQLISRGDLTQRVEIRGSDEIAELGRSFNSMAEGLNKDREWRHQMLADIAHELRTPLFVLQGNTEAMLEGVLPADKNNLNTIHQETLLLSRLVEDLRTLSLAEVGQLKFQPVTTDLKALSMKAIEGFKSQFTAKNINFSLEVTGNHFMAIADPNRTEQILRNLLANALHYTPEGGNISVKIDSREDRLVVSVIDSGIGIDEKDLARIFDRFYRVDRSRSRSTGGTGLGLAIVKQLVEGQCGVVRAESTVGKGSAFSFSLPPAIT